MIPYHTPRNGCSRPDAEERRFLTLPAHHAFERSSGDHGNSAELLATARRVLAGELAEAAAAAAMTRTLVAWSHATA